MHADELTSEQKQMLLDMLKNRVGTAQYNELLSQVNWDEDQLVELLLLQMQKGAPNSIPATSSAADNAKGGWVSTVVPIVVALLLVGLAFGIIYGIARLCGADNSSAENIAGYSCWLALVAPGLLSWLHGLVGRTGCIGIVVAVLLSIPLLIWVNRFGETALTFSVIALLASIALFVVLAHNIKPISIYPYHRESPEEYYPGFAIVSLIAFGVLEGIYFLIRRIMIH